MVWNLNKQEDVNGCVEHTLTAHQRAITDINFSAHHPDIFATCAVDGHVHLWDLRRPKKPAITFTDWFAGATQVKCNRQDSHILASSHDRWLRIWDDRKSAIPIRSIDAHASKIYGVDWNRTRGTAIVTCSLDKTIKFWDYSTELDEEEHIIRTGFPVWRARHTPFGNGLLAMPQDAPGDLHLYEPRIFDGAFKSTTNQVVKIFPSYDNVKVKEFLWRSRGDITEDGIDNRDFQLVSWGDDNNLRLQTIEPGVLSSVGYFKGTKIPQGLNITRMGAAYKTFRVFENTVTRRKTSTITRTPKPMSCGFKMNALQVGMNKNFTSKLGKPHLETILPRTMIKAKHMYLGEEKGSRQIDWMSGIRINSSGYNLTQKHSSRQISIPDSDLKGEREWDRPESLHDEIARIHNQLPMIMFDDVDMQSRTVVASMNGPWADDSSSVYIKVTIAFPNCYPEMEPPLFQIENTSLIPSSIHSKISCDIQQIASSFTTRSQGCLETVFRYLLGELDYEASIFLNDIRIFDENFSIVDESSSDDEESNFPPGISAGPLPSVNRNANVPIPRLCGATFSTNGNLVFFYSPTKHKVKSLLATMVNCDTRPREKPYFERFGRFQNNPLSFGDKTRSLTLTSESESDSGVSETSDSSNSCDSNFSFQHGQPLFLKYAGDYASRPFRHAPTTSDSHISSEAITGTGIGTGTESWVMKPKSLITIYSVKDILPSKIELAKYYIVCGDSSKVCEHNASVAERHGYRDLTDIWNFVAILLCNEVPQSLIGMVPQGSSLEDFSCNIKPKWLLKGTAYSSFPGISLAHVKWGTHPLAAAFVHDIFGYFELLGDIQMLAMLSCIFSKPVTRDGSTNESLTMQSQMASPAQPRINLDCSLIDVTNTTLEKTPTRSSIAVSKPLQMFSGKYGSMGSAPGAWSIDPFPISYSCDDAPPLETAWTNLGRRNRKSQSLSASPERIGKAFRRVNSVGLASTFAASFYRFTSSSSSPPKNPLSRRKVSSVEQILSSLASSGITWGNTKILGSLKEHERINHDLDSIGKSDTSSVCTGIKVVHKNTHLFDEKTSHTPFLNPNNAALYAHYRATYARMLHSWDASINSLEILKYNAFLAPQVSETNLDSNASYPILNQLSDPNRILSKEEKSLSPPAPEGLDITGFCTKHESRLEPLSANIQAGGAAGRCKRCKMNQYQLRCTICYEPVSSAFCPCLSCGCVSHLDCLTTYHLAGHTYCPGGCDCDCTVKAGMGIVESWEVMMGSLII